MKQGYLSQYFKGIAVKRLSAVEARPEVSRQHEFNGVGRLTAVLGEAIPRKKFAATFFYLNDDDPEPIEAEGSVTWYDARENHPTRSENRLYFPSTAVSDNAAEGDLLLIARKPDDSLIVIVVEAESTMENQLLWLMGENDIVHLGFSVKGEIENDQIKLDFISRLILEQVGIEATETDENYLDQMLREFGGKFPDTATLSIFVRSLVRIDPTEDPDSALVAWYEKEFILFRTLEEYFLSSKIKDGFPSVKEFLDLSLSVQNRRKSRAGCALQNHLTPIFQAHKLRFETQGSTEHKQKPDFLFPGAREYHDPLFPTGKLLMLGAKTSCKDRWRQVLAEAAKIKEKHLCTLEAGISENQTSQMAAHGLRLVVPRQYHSTFNAKQREWLLSLKDFIDIARTTQS
ncbi:type II restriction endonuclease [Ralstonia wenshanensis]|uniref:type II restriction endonuclease n=1 Tax=Ralstonia wenshanensis TaxID=2842456 RepID=UPI0021B25546|nr:type II restriction endonuclease [Ralstonia wenshanensis]MCT7308428.1 type II restriction endonuclease [Ralstonia wenshanensis]